MAPGPAGTFSPHLPEEAVGPACCLEVALPAFFQQGILPQLLSHLYACGWSFSPIPLEISEVTSRCEQEVSAFLLDAFPGMALEAQAPVRGPFTLGIKTSDFAHSCL